MIEELIRWQCRLTQYIKVCISKDVAMLICGIALDDLCITRCKVAVGNAILGDYPTGVPG